MVVGVHRHPATLLLTGPSKGLLVPAQARFRDRLVVLWRARRLDRALAAGTEPEASASLALRAQQLVEPRCRRSIATGLRQILDDAYAGCRASAGRVRPDAAGVKAAKLQLLALAEGLDEPGPVAAGGVAKAWLLLTDGTGPLYNPRSRASLRACAEVAALALRRPSLLL